METARHTYACYFCRTKKARCEKTAPPALKLVQIESEPVVTLRPAFLGDQIVLNWVVVEAITILV